MNDYGPEYSHDDSVLTSEGSLSVDHKQATTTLMSPCVKDSANIDTMFMRTPG